MVSDCEFINHRNLGLLHNLNIHYPETGAFHLHLTRSLLKNSSSSIASGLTGRAGNNESKGRRTSCPDAWKPARPQRSAAEGCERATAPGSITASRRGSDPSPDLLAQPLLRPKPSACKLAAQPPEGWHCAGHSPGNTPQVLFLSSH